MVMRTSIAVVVIAAVVTAAAGCAVDQATTSPPAAAAPTPEPMATPSASQPWTVDFEANFESDEGSADVPGAPGLPVALFPDDGSQWTQLQNTHPEVNRVELRSVVRDGQRGSALACYAAAQADGIASKADLGRQGFSFGPGAQVRIRSDLYVDPGEGQDVLRDNTLIDLEDTDDVLIGGTSPGAGLRLRVDGQGRLALDRGEVPGREAPGLSPVPRLSNLRSDYVLPVRQWMTIELTLQLGADASVSTTPVDPDSRREPAWVEVHVTIAGESQLVLAMSGANLLDPVAIRQLFDEQDPSAQVDIADVIDYDSLQVCATNNRSSDDVLVMVDNLTVTSRSTS